MRERRWRHLVAVAVVLFAAVVSGCSATVPAQTPETQGRAPFSTADNGANSHGSMRVTGVTSVGQRSWSLSVDTDTVDPEATREDAINVLVTLPEDYSPEETYPVIYLLQGSESDYMQWFDEGYVEEAFADRSAILVMPEGGVAGWYSNWANSPFAQQWREFHLEEVVPWIDEHLPTRKDRSQRAIMGVSMGGYGAISYAEQRPDLFGSAVSLSGLLSTDQRDASAFVRNQVKEVTGNANDLGGRAAESATSNAEFKAGKGLSDPSSKVQQLANTRVWIANGNGNPQESLETGAGMEAELKKSAQTFATQAKRAKVPLRENYFGASKDCNADHSWACWRVEVDSILPGLMTAFTSSPSSTPSSAESRKQP